MSGAAHKGTLLGPPRLGHAAAAKPQQRREATPPLKKVLLNRWLKVGKTPPLDGELQNSLLAQPLIMQQHLLH